MLPSKQCDCSADLWLCASHPLTHLCKYHTLLNFKMDMEKGAASPGYCKKSDDGIQPPASAAEGTQQPGSLLPFLVPKSNESMQCSLRLLNEKHYLTKALFIEHFASVHYGAQRGRK